jgi:predicted DCC family thiol-disulfide oxidoreductase YuxK
MTSPVLLYDGACGLCAASVQLILRWDRRKTLEFAPLDGRFAATIRARHPEIDRVDSMVWLEPTGDADQLQVHTRSDAALRAAAYLGGPWRLVLLARLLPHAVRDRAYDFIAGHRHLLSRQREQCLTPPANARARFLP